MSRRCRCSTAAARWPTSAARRSAACSSRSSAHRWRCWPTRCRSSARPSSCGASGRPNLRSSPRAVRSVDGSLAGLAFVIRDPIIRPSMLAVTTINLFNFAFAALFILYATDDPRRLAGGPRPRARRRRDRWPARGGRRVADRPADRSRPGLRARLHHLPGVADPRADRRARDADAGDPRSDPRLGVRGGTGRHDPRHQHRVDQQRPDRRTGSGHGPTGRTDPSTTACGRSARCSAACSARRSVSARRSSS